MSVPDLVVIDTEELRRAAAAMRRAADQAADLRLRIPQGVDGAPDWLEGRNAPDLARSARDVDEIVADLLAQAGELEARAAAVEGAEQRWADVSASGTVCGCVLPSGEVVAQAPAGGTATSSASGPGVDLAVGAGVLAAGAVGLAASGGGSTFTDVGNGVGVTMVGGPNSLQEFTVSQPALVVPPLAQGSTVIGGDTLFPSYSVVRADGQTFDPIVTTSAGVGFGYLSVPAADFGEQGADLMTNRIFSGGMIGAGTSGGLVGTASLGDLIRSQDLAAAHQSAMVLGSDYAVYGGHVDLVSDHLGETPGI